MEELKRYRNSFILLTLVSAVGILTGLYLYEYTGFFASLKESAQILPPTEFDAAYLLSLFFDEARILAIVFMFGFTLFAPYSAALILIYKGFMTGFSSLYFGICYQKGSIDKQVFVLTCASMVFLLLVYIITGAKSIAFSASLRYAAPDLAALFKRRQTGKYIVTFLLMSVFLLIAVVLKYSIPLM